MALEKVGELFVKLFADTGDYRKDLRRAESDNQRFARSADGVTRSVGRMGNAVNRAGRQAGRGVGGAGRAVGSGFGRATGLLATGGVAGLAASQLDSLRALGLELNGSSADRLIGSETTQIGRTSAAGSLGGLQSAIRQNIADLDNRQAALSGRIANLGDLTTIGGIKNLLSGGKLGAALEQDLLRTQKRRTAEAERLSRVSERLIEDEVNRSEAAALGTPTDRARAASRSRVFALEERERAARTEGNDALVKGIQRLIDLEQDLLRKQETLIRIQRDAPVRQRRESAFLENLSVQRLRGIERNTRQRGRRG